jgi:iron-sulfur cluster assembly accessory protein
MTTLVTITDAAKQHLINILDKEQKPYVLFGVDGGGCAGFQYYWEVNDNCDPEGETIELEDGKNLAIDRASLMYVVGSTIDYTSDLTGSMLRVDNPLAHSSCGCGESISF